MDDDRTRGPSSSDASSHSKTGSRASGAGKASGSRARQHSPSAAEPFNHLEREYALLDRLAQRDMEALRELYQIYATPLFSYAMRTLGSTEDAEEALQDVFVRIWNKSPKYDSSKAKPFTWSVMMIRGICFDILRKRSTRKYAKTISLDSTQESLISIDDGIESLFFTETRRRVKRALQKLSGGERACIELSVFHDITHHEIAERLEEPLGTVKSRIRRGLIKLRSILKSDHE